MSTNSAVRSIDLLATELVRRVAYFLDNDSKRVFRQTGRLVNNAGQLHFAADCFAHMLVSLAPESLGKLSQAAVHPQYGPAISSITYRISGVEDLSTTAIACLDAVVEALRDRKQKVKLEVHVNAIAISGSNSIERTIFDFYRYLLDATSENVAQGTVILDLPSPPKTSMRASARSLLYDCIAMISSTKNIHITYSDQCSKSSLVYDLKSKTLILSGLRVNHIHELRYFFSGLDLNKVVIEHSAIDVSTVKRICSDNMGTLRTITIQDVALWERWSHGDVVPASWKQTLTTIARLPALSSCTLANLHKENLLPTWGDEASSPFLPQVVSFSARGLATVNHGLKTLISSTQW